MKKSDSRIVFFCCGFSGSSGLDEASMEPGLVGCIGDIWEVLVLRRRGTEGLHLLLLCWLLAAHLTAHGEWKNVCFLRPPRSVRVLPLCVFVCVCVKERER